MNTTADGTLTISEVQRIFTDRQCEGHIGESYLVLDTINRKIIGRIKFEEIDVDEIILEEKYTTQYEKI